MNLRRMAIWAAAACGAAACSKTSGGDAGAGGDAQADLKNWRTDGQIEERSPGDLPQDGEQDAGQSDGKDAGPTDSAPDKLPAVTCMPAGVTAWTWKSPGDYKVTALAVLGDVTGDGKPDIAATAVPFPPKDTDNFVYVIDGASGATVWAARPQNTAGQAGPASTDTETVIADAPSLAPGGGDGLLFAAAGAARTVFALDGKTGKEIWEYDTHADGMDIVDRVAPIGDLSGDGVPEVLFTELANGLALLVDGAKGTVRWKFMVGSGAELQDGAPIGDLSGDGKPDVLLSSGMLYPSDKVYAIDSSSGKTIWEAGTGDPSTGSIFLLGAGDLNGDGKPDAVAAIGGYGLTAFSGKDGNPLWTSELSSTVAIYRLAGAGDLDGDGAPDVLLGTSCSLCPGGDGVRVVSGKTGKILWSGMAAKIAATVDRVGDVDGDGREEVAEGSFDGRVRLYSGATGEKIWEAFPGTGQIRSVRGTPDLTGDGRPDVVAATDNPGRVYLVSGCTPK